MFITLRFKILPKNNKDKQTILNLMRAYSSCHRFLPIWFILSAISEAKELLKSKKRKVVFGGKRLFTQLCIHNLQGWRLEEVKREWREKRKGNLLSIGHNKYGNPITFLLTSTIIGFLFSNDVIFKYNPFSLKINFI